ncbi:unnamed protein product, partial [marine sediment metagenome]
MGILVYMDEAGDHSLELIDRDFPVFCLAFFVCEETIYVQKVVPEVIQFKLRWFGHEGVILHSRDIRKAQGDFGLLTNPDRRQAFMGGLSAIMSHSDYKLIAVAIRKQEHKERYGMRAENPYDLAMTFALERLLPLLAEARQNMVTIIAESRGKREDKELHASFLNVVNYGTYYVPRGRFKGVDFSLRFVEKSRNIVGTQLADLVAYPTARHVLDP